MIPAKHLSQEDLALFGLQLLEGDELQAALDHLEICEACRQEVARYQGDLAGYALALSEMHSPPAQARERLLKAVAKEKKAAPQEPVAPLRRSSTAIPIAQDLRQDPRVDTWREASGEMRVTHRGNDRIHDRAESGVHPRAVPDDRELFLAARGSRMFTPEPVQPEEHEPEREREREREREVVVRQPSGAASFLGWAGWAVAAGLAVVAGLQYRERQNLQGDVNAVSAKLAQVNNSLAGAQTALSTLTDAGAMQVALHIPVNGQPEPPQPAGHAAYNPDKGSLVFIGSHLQPLQVGKTYELWLIPVEGSPIPAGTFKPDAQGVGTVVMPSIPKGVAAKGFGVTVENDGGSSTPTPPIVLAGM